MGKNKLSKFYDMAEFSHVLEYPFYKLKDQGFRFKGKWNEELFHNTNPIVLELGCGKGEYTVGLALKNPNKNYVGIDIKGARMWTGAKMALEKNLNNVIFLRTEIEFIEYFFNKNEVYEIWITFCDPQMKKATKRLTSSYFLNRYKNILIPFGYIHLKTDSNFLFQYTKELVNCNNLSIKHCTDDLYKESEKIEPAMSIQTYYEQQWLSRGFSIKYLVFSPFNSFKLDLREPDVDIERDPYRSFGRSRR